MKVKIFDFEDEGDLEDAINNFLKELEGDVVELSIKLVLFLVVKNKSIVSLL